MKDSSKISPHGILCNNGASFRWYLTEVRDYSLVDKFKRLRIDVKGDAIRFVQRNHVVQQRLEAYLG